MPWTRTSIKGFISTTPKSKYGKGVGTGLSSIANLNESASQVTEKLATPGAFQFHDLDDIYFNSTYTTTNGFEEDGVSEWYRDYGTFTDAGLADDPGEGDVDEAGMSLILSAAQKTQFASLLDDADDLFTFDGVNAQGIGSLVHPDGFTGTNGTMTASDGICSINGSDSYMNNFKGYLPITCTIGTHYVITLELLGATSTAGFGYITMGILNASELTYVHYPQLIRLMDVGVYTSEPIEATAETMYFHIQNSKQAQGVQINDLAITEVS